MSAFTPEEQEKLAAALFTLHLGDCITEMAKLPADSVDAIVTDPPYGIRFMGKAWDGDDIEARAATRRSFDSHDPDAGPNGGHKSIAAEAGKYDMAPSAMRAFQEFSEAWAREALRVLKPGGHLLSFAAARTYHRMACGIEDAGFQVRDQIMWIFGSGFPKAEIWSAAKAAKGNAECAKMIDAGFEGWARGGLKPAHEPILMARKPFTGNVACNVLKHGTGAINVDGCRVVTDEVLSIGAGGTWDALKRHEGRPSRNGEASAQRRYTENGGTNFAMKPGIRGGDLAGRFPSNVIHDGSDEVLAVFPDAAGQQGRITGSEPTANGFSGVVAFTNLHGRDATEPRADSTKNAARFYYCAKTSKTDRNEGLDTFSMGSGSMRNAAGRPLNPFCATTGKRVQDCDCKPTCDWVKPEESNKNPHPTVKPTDLMAYLARMVTPPGGVVLDPFMGSGSTGKACMREGLQFIGIELESDYMAIARARVEHEIVAIAQRKVAEAEAQRAASMQKTIFELDGI